ncbi:type I-U CRISPR-associated protein Cas5/Cas6 [Heliobacterium gestii]|uniref:Type I-U CRISPR-associated protein Cas5/Cas6 n=1 Tax=Heliomicrobium gestii TaxID=2699 RepID=A0A845LBE1_HELGE|nr:type I-U CRISPR-associated protein Csb2 [Heliomicrobium gestii]MBM7867087.1 CRISPR-associated protein Csb2 [Heliomicrobium gestii]MZP43498.1 type I-U CRISPR-associated protein Cas5/Cas6 [Heliomicrobium gestii]
MFAIGIHYLNGWAAATNPSNWDRAEWPPHPDRLFMALVSAHFETGEESIERDSLLWLESLTYPAIHASGAVERQMAVPGSSIRNFTGVRAVTKYVPVNDTPKKPERLKLLPELREKRGRTFPVVIPESPFVYFIWADAQPTEEIEAGLAQLCAKVAYLGHSTSLVQVWVEKAPPKPSLVPTKQRGDVRLRVFGEGRLGRLIHLYDSGPIRPSANLWCSYRQAVEEKETEYIASTAFDENIIILRKISGPLIGIESALTVCRFLRDTVLKLATQPIPEWLSGHGPDGSPSRHIHAAFFPLPHVGFQYSDGHLIGLGIALPKSVDPEEVRQVLSSVFYDATWYPRKIQLVMGRLGEWNLVLDNLESRPTALQPWLWTGSGTKQKTDTWATVTPITLHRHLKLTAEEKALLASEEEPRRTTIRQKMLNRKCEELIRQACRFVGIPEPVTIQLMKTSVFAGVPHIKQYPLLERRPGEQLPHTHAILKFPCPVRGPLLLGAGLHRGYGLCRPWFGMKREEGDDDPRPGRV